MACDRDTVLLISCYADGEAGPEGASRATAHLEGCGECRKLAEDWSKQRAMLEWAYTTELPEQAEMAWGEEATTMAKRISVAERVPAWMRLRARWAWTAALAVAVLAGLVVHHMVTLPPMLRAGMLMAVGSTPESARLDGGTDLQVGPGSAIRCLDSRSIRLEKGWVSASVRHGLGLRVLTERITVIDRGTVFRVGTGPRGDYVMVSEGSVSVSKGHATRHVGAGQILTAYGEGEPYVASLPEERPEDENAGIPFDRREPRFQPSEARSLDWTEGVLRLASRFPDARLSGVYSSGTSRQGGMVFDYGMGSIVGLRKGLREHSADIAQAIAGGTTGPGRWEIPVAVLLLSPAVSEPQLPADVYHVRLVCENDRLVWRLTGSRGGQADYPFAVGSREADLQKYGSFGEGSAESLDHFSSLVIARGKPSVLRLSFRLSGWPGKLKPGIELELGGIPISESEPDKTALRAELAGSVPKMVEPTLLYLDPERKSRFLIAWNADAGKELCRISDLAKQGSGGSALLGGFVTDEALAEPKLGPGAYLVRFMLPGPNDKPHIEIADVRASAGSCVLKATIPGNDPNNYYAQEPESLPGYGRVRLRLGIESAEHGAFPFRFQVTGRPGDTSTRPIKDGSRTTMREPTGTWAEGWIRVRQP